MEREEQDQKSTADAAGCLSGKVGGHGATDGEREQSYVMPNGRLSFGAGLDQDAEERILDFDHSRLRSDNQQMFPDFLKFKANLEYDSFLMEEQE